VLPDGGHAYPPSMAANSAACCVFPDGVLTYETRAQDEAFAGELTAIRRDIHAHPELGFEEARTSAIVGHKLKDSAARSRRRRQPVSWHVRVGNNPRAIGLRADMDARRWTAQHLDHVRSTAAACTPAA